ncbi:MAG: acetolactate decarboxylase [Clostridiales bacterium]|nr:acetolactate decarboxylase [Clostridiales bacterium]
MLKKCCAMITMALLILSAVACSAQKAEPADREVLYQVSTINALLAGYYDGQVSIEKLKEYGDTGIGTFADLDGEMIVLDGIVYRAKYDGTVKKAGDAESTPFAAVTFFDEDQILKNAAFTDLESLKQILDNQIQNPNLFYTFKITGEFSLIEVRSVPPQEKPYPPLTEVVKDQPTFTYENVKGTLVGFWCPAYVAGINVSGYHLHFISEDTATGGHLLDAASLSATIRVDQTPTFQMTLPEDSAFGDLILQEDKADEIEKVEK